MTVIPTGVLDGSGKQRSGVGEERTGEGSTRVSKVEEGTTCMLGVQMEKNVSYQPSNNLILVAQAYGTKNGNYL